MSIFDQTKQKMTKAIEHFKDELKSIRTGRANPAMLDHLVVEVYGTQVGIKEIASITTPDPRQLLITPFDPQNRGSIGKAIEKANLGFMPIVDGNAVRLPIPPMDEALRKKMCDEARKRREEAKVSIRQIRREANDLAKKQKTSGELTEDMMKKLEKNIQELTDQSCREADVLTEKKEKEIMTI